MLTQILCAPEAKAKAEHGHTNDYILVGQVEVIHGLSAQFVLLEFISNINPAPEAKAKAEHAGIRYYLIQIMDSSQSN